MISKTYVKFNSEKGVIQWTVTVDDCCNLFPVWNEMTVSKVSSTCGHFYGCCFVVLELYYNFSKSGQVVPHSSVKCGLHMFRFLVLPTLGWCKKLVNIQLLHASNSVVCQRFSYREVVSLMWSWASLCDGPLLCVTCYSSVHHHYFPLPVCGDVWWHGSWPADDLCRSLSCHPREPPPGPEEWQRGTVRHKTSVLLYVLLCTAIQPINTQRHTAWLVLYFTGLLFCCFAFVCKTEALQR